MKCQGFAILFLALLVPIVGVNGGEDELGDDTRVLIIIDIQDFYFDGGAMPLDGAVAAAETAARVLERFRGLQWPVVHIQHLPKDLETPGQDVQPTSYRIHSLVAPAPGETIIGKHHANAFRDTGLLEHLRSLGINQLVIVGMQTHMCLEAATRAAGDLGFEVVVVRDACATRDLSFAGTTVPAAQVHTSTLASLDRSYAQIVSVDQLLAGLPAVSPSAGP